MLKDVNAGAVVTGWEAELEAAAGVNDGNSVAGGAASAGCEVDAEVGRKLSVGAAVEATDVAALLDAGVGWAPPPNLKPTKGAVAEFEAVSSLDDAGGKVNSDFCPLEPAAEVAPVIGGNRLLVLWGFGAFLLVKEKGGAGAVANGGATAAASLFG
jgi:hypothetical protein